MKRPITKQEIEIVCDWCHQNDAESKCIGGCNRDICEECKGTTRQDIVYLIDGIICPDCLKKIPIPKEVLTEQLTDCEESDVENLFYAKPESWIVLFRGEGEFQLDICESEEKAKEVLVERIEESHDYKDYIGLFHDGKEYEYESKTVIIIKKP